MSTIAVTASAEPTSPLVSLRDVHFAYGERAVLRGIDLSVHRGQVVAIMGGSGCGKTTLLRLIAGLEVPTAGRVLLDGQTVSGPDAFVPPERRRIGLVFQDYALFPHLSVLDNVRFGLPDRRGPDSRALAEAALARVGLARHAGSHPHMLSGGEQQRVALARALAPQPRVLLMDEPFSNLDRRLRDQVRDDTMALLRESGTTAVVVTHDPEEALRIADRIVLMHAGRVAQEGSPEVLYHQPASLFAARFFSDLNRIPGQRDARGIATALGLFPATGPADAASDIYLRPQDIHLVPAADDDTTAGQITRRVFLGHGQALHVRVPGLPDDLLLWHAGGHAPATGDSVHLRPDRARALRFSADIPA